MTTIENDWNFATQTHCRHNTHKCTPNILLLSTNITHIGVLITSIIQITKNNRIIILEWLMDYLFQIQMDKVKTQMFHGDK